MTRVVLYPAGHERGLVPMTVVSGPFPAESHMEPERLAAADYWDSFRAPLTRTDAGVTDLFHAVLGHHPMWLKRVLIARNAVARQFGLEAPVAADVLEPALRSDYRVGDVIGVWPTYHLSENELIAGRDNGHLDFRVSVLRDEQTVAVSTVCNAHNVYGRLYLRVIVPFHRAGLRWLMARAVRSGRL